MSIRWRWALTVAAVAFGAFVVAAVASFITAGAEFRGEIDADLRRRADAIVEVTRVAGRRGNPFGPRQFRLDASTIAGYDAIIQVVSVDGDVEPVFADAPALPVDEADLAIAADRRGQGAFRDVVVDEEPFRVYTFPVADGVAFQVARSLAEETAILAELRRNLILFGVAAAALAAVAGWVLAGRTTAPVLRLGDAAARVAATKDFDQPIDVEGTDEVGRLAESFNAMLVALSASQDQQHRLVMDASHELRTPITSLRTNIEVLARNPGMDDSERQKIMSDLETELRELTALVEELVELATDRRESEPVGPVAMRALADRVAEAASRRFGRAVDVVGDGVTVLGRSAQLERALTNLVDNAIKWSPDPSPVVIRLEPDRVTVEDAGAGIAAEDRTRVFDRFYRAVDDRSMPGSGLGLSIVAQAAADHGGEGFVRDSDSGGAAVGFTFSGGQVDGPH